MEYYCSTSTSLAFSSMMEKIKVLTVKCTQLLKVFKEYRFFFSIWAKKERKKEAMKKDVKKITKIRFLVKTGL